MTTATAYRGNIWVKGGNEVGTEHETFRRGDGEARSYRRTHMRFSRHFSVDGAEAGTARGIDPRYMGNRMFCDDHSQRITS